MNIEQKNTLFVSLFVVMIIVSVSLLLSYLVRQHVRNQSDTTLQRGFDTALSLLQKNYQSLLRSSRTLATRSDFLSALREDPAHVRSLLESELQAGAADFIAVYRVQGSSQYFGAARRVHLSSSSVLASEALLSLVQGIKQSDTPSRRYTLVYDELLHIAAVPVHDGAGNVTAVLIQAQHVSSDMLNELANLLHVDIMLYRPNLVLGATHLGLTYQVDQLSNIVNIHRMQDLTLEGRHYYARIFPLKDTSQDKPQAYLLTAVDGESEWRAYRDMLNQAGYSALLVLLVAALLGIYASRAWLTRPIKSLAQASVAVGNGDLNVSIGQQDRGDELGDLARSFDQMLHQLKQARNDEAVTRERFLDFAESSSDWMWESDAEGLFTYVSPSVKATLGVSAEQMLGENICARFAQDRMNDLYLHLSPEAERHEAFRDIEVWATNTDGYRLCLLLTGIPYFDQGRFRGYRGTARDITKAKTDEARLVRLANKDHLSGLSNRTRFMEDLKREIDLCKRQHTQGVLLLIDLDHFKLINDTVGHAAGDEVIVQIAGLLRRLTRNVDLVARLSGDEFVIAYINTDISQIQKRANDILKGIAQLKPTYEGKILSTTASIGMVVFPDDGATPIELMAKSDMAMYAAKMSGRNRAHLYHVDDMQQEIMGTQLAWKQRIHEALEKDLFTLVYQPIMPTTGETSTRYEVLVRMRGPNGKIYTPGSFIPTAEQFGLIRDIDDWVVRKAIHELAQLRQQEHISFSINLSGLSVGEPEMLKIIETALADSGIDRRRIIFEVTESTAFQDINRAYNFITRIKQMGCQIALDDFGVGFSSFSYLKQLRADILKIDGSFIRDIHVNKDDQLFVKALVDVARGMGMVTVAEFVESVECYTMVRSLGVDYVQGTFVGEPRSGLA